jgi:hypothetical protein
LMYLYSIVSCVVSMSLRFIPNATAIFLKKKF